MLTKTVAATAGLLLTASLITPMVSAATPAAVRLSVQQDKSVPGGSVPAVPFTDPPVPPKTVTDKLTATAKSAAAVQVQVLDQNSPRGVLLRVGRTDGSAAKAPAVLAVAGKTLPGLHGGDWVNRLQVRALPDCALTTPDKAACQGTPVAAERKSGTVTANVTTGTVYALTAAVSGSSGTFAATKLAPSSTWSEGGSSGDFTWSYDISVPPSPGKLAPTVSLAYSSQSVDGETAATNNQPSWVGEGFDYEPGSITRAYKACADDMGGTANNTVKTGDECWATDNAVLNLNGRTVELVRDDATGTFHPRQDDGSRIEHLTGAANGDNDGEYWRVTTVDGTQYYFGLSRLPGWSTGKPVTNSTWNVPVYGNNAGDPCHQATFDASWCQQAWQWNLDYVVDAHGNSMSYWYTAESNSYARDNDATKVTPYTRGGYLTRIDYGTRTDAEFGTAPEQVVFGVADRCTSNCGSHGANWPDTPWDLACAGSSCPTGSPTFWITRRLATITTHVAGVGDVQSWTLAQTYPDPGDATRAGLWLAGISQKGLVGGTATVPDVTFTGVQLANRVDTGSDQVPAMNWWRIASIRNGTGGETSVSYSAPDCVAGSRVPTTPENNTLRCYPVKWTPDGWTNQKQDYFQKYVVTDVTETDHTGGAPRVVTHYDYLGEPAWHYVDGDGLVPPSQKTWSQWRGYGQVRTTVDTQVILATYFRGMDGDKLPTGVRQVSVQGVADSDALAGKEREIVTYNGSSEVNGTVTTPWLSGATAKRTIDGVTVLAQRSGDAVTETRTALDGGRGNRMTKVTQQFDSYGMVVQKDDTGDEAVSGDEQCTRTSYVRNTAAWLLDKPSQVEVDGLPCGTNATRADDVISDTRTSYDNQAWGVVPTKGDATQTDVFKDIGAFLTDHRTAYDAYGRVTDTWDIRGGHSTTAFTPATGLATHTTDTDPTGAVTVTDLQTAWNLPVDKIDANGKRTDLAYDSLGRLVAVWLPGRAKATQTASTTYAYTVRADGAVAVSTSTINPDGGYVTSFQLYDGLLRTRQTQRPASGPQGGRVVTDTFYDTAGRVCKTNQDYVADGAPSADLFGPTNDNVVPDQTLTVFDDAGRATASVQRSLGVELWRATTAYGGDHTQVTPPAGGIATDTWTDVRGNTTKLSEATGDIQYHYDNRDLLASVTDVDGSTWTYRYDSRGRQIQVDDPDKGNSTSGYDDAGDVTSTTDSRGVTLTYGYDVLGRKTAEYQGSAQLAGWTYDTVAKGQLSSSTKYVNENAYTTTIGGYSDGYQPTLTTITLPAAEGALAGSYAFPTTYKQDGSIATTTLPAMGGLPQETVGYSYDALGEAATMTGTTSYVTAAQYTRYGEPAVYTFSDGGPIAQTGLYYDDVTRRLAESKTIRETSPATISDTHYTWSAGGELTAADDTQSGDAQCFGYDAVQRLVQAWTPASGDCSAAPGVLGGPAPYWQSWTYDSAGDRLSQSDHIQGNTTAYQYGKDQPHAVLSTSDGNQYGYDAAGHTVTRPAQRLTWNADGELAAVNGDTYVDDLSGQRLISHDSTGTTLYLPGEELHVAAGASTATATRYYSFGGHPVAQRTSAGLTWLVPDWQNTDQIAIGADGAQDVTQRRQTPFGDPRGVAVNWPDQHGFVQGIDDPTGLVAIGVRQYDPTLGRFLSVDPELDTGDTQQMQGYAYADDSPTTHSDPTGKHLACGGEGGDDTPCPPGGGGTSGCVVLGCGSGGGYTGGSSAGGGGGGGGGDGEQVGHGIDSGVPSLVKYGPPKRKTRVLAPGPLKTKPFHFTFSVCTSAGIGYLLQFSQQYCIGADRKGVFTDATRSTPASPANGLDLGAGLGFQISDADTKDQLAGPFNYVGGGVGPAWGTWSWGGHTHVGDFGIGAGWDAGYQGGRSYTTVSPYWLRW